MSVRYFCDGCGTELGRNVVNERYTPSKYFSGPHGSNKNISLEIIVSIGKIANAGHVCLLCLKDVVNNPDCEVTSR